MRICTGSVRARPRHLGVFALGVVGLTVMHGSLGWGASTKSHDRLKPPVAVRSSGNTIRTSRGHYCRRRPTCPLALPNPHPRPRLLTRVGNTLVVNLHRTPRRVFIAFGKPRARDPSVVRIVAERSAKVVSGSSGVEWKIRAPKRLRATALFLEASYPRGSVAYLGGVHVERARNQA